MTSHPKCEVVLLGAGTPAISRKRTCEVNRMGENSSFIFICYVKTVPVYDFKLVWVVLQSSVKQFFETLH